MAMLEAMLEGVPVLTNIPVHQQLTAGELGSPRSGSRDTGHALKLEIWTPVPCLDWAIHHPQELAAMARNAQTYVDQL